VRTFDSYLSRVILFLVLTSMRGIETPIKTAKMPYSIGIIRGAVAPSVLPQLNERLSHEQHLSQSNNDVNKNTHKTNEMHLL